MRKVIPPDGYELVQVEHGDIVPEGAKFLEPDGSWEDSLCVGSKSIGEQIYAVPRNEAAKNAAPASAPSTVPFSSSDVKIVPGVSTVPASAPTPMDPNTVALNLRITTIERQLERLRGTLYSRSAHTDSVTLSDELRELALALDA